MHRGDCNSTLVAPTFSKPVCLFVCLFDPDLEPTTVLELYGTSITTTPLSARGSVVCPGVLTAECRARLSRHAEKDYVESHVPHSYAAILDNVSPSAVKFRQRKGDKAFCQERAHHQTHIHSFEAESVHARAKASALHHGSEGTQADIDAGWRLCRGQFPWSPCSRRST